MFSFTKRADYALLALSYLASAAVVDPDRLVNTKEISDQYHIPIEMLAKILQVMARSGLVVSHPGPTGGYRLGRNAETISISDVVNSIDGQLGIVHCSNGNDALCEQFNHCTIRTPLYELEARMNSLLQQISIREISQEPALPH
jgi:Rrf2 family transcriptional regulator, cysteine metabolism repressor